MDSFEHSKSYWRYRDESGIDKMTGYSNDILMTVWMNAREDLLATLKLQAKNKQSNTTKGKRHDNEPSA